MLIVVAGMEGALPSVVAGLLDKPVIAVPTSVGYGRAFGGIAALLGMLNSCASGVTVVNIDNGFGAAFAATLINRVGNRARRGRDGEAKLNHQRPRAARDQDGRTRLAGWVELPVELDPAAVSHRAGQDRELLETHIRNAQRIVESSTHLRGAFMKLIQMLSMRAGSPARRGARRAQGDAIERAADELFDHLGSDSHARSANGPSRSSRSSTRPRSPPPRSARCIARPRATAREVAVKVQYPGVEETVEQDLRNLKMLLRTLQAIGRDVMRQKIECNAVYKELEAATARRARLRDARRAT